MIFKLEKRRCAEQVDVDGNVPGLRLVLLVLDLVSLLPAVLSLAYRVNTVQKGLDLLKSSYSSPFEVICGQEGSQAAARMSL